MASLDPHLREDTAMTEVEHKKIDPPIFSLLEILRKVSSFKSTASFLLLRSWFHRFIHFCH